MVDNVTKEAHEKSAARFILSFPMPTLWFSAKCCQKIENIDWREYCASAVLENVGACWKQEAFFKTVIGLAVSSCNSNSTGGRENYRHSSAAHKNSNLTCLKIAIRTKQRLMAGAKWLLHCVYGLSPVELSSLSGLFRVRRGLRTRCRQVWMLCFLITDPIEICRWRITHSLLVLKIAGILRIVAPDPLESKRWNSSLNDNNVRMRKKFKILRCNLSSNISSCTNKQTNKSIADAA